MDRTLETTFNRFKLIFNEKELDRITCDEENGNKIIIVDVHGMKCSAVERFVHNIITIVHAAFNLLIIHGYHGGTAIRDMLRTGFIDSRVLSVAPDINNDGRTFLVCGA